MRAVSSAAFFLVFLLLPAFADSSTPPTFCFLFYSPSLLFIASAVVFFPVRVSGPMRRDFFSGQPVCSRPLCLAHFWLALTRSSATRRAPSPSIERDFSRSIAREIRRPASRFHFARRHRPPPRPSDGRLLISSRSGPAKNFPRPRRRNATRRRSISNLVYKISFFPFDRSNPTRDVRISGFFESLTAAPLSCCRPRYRFLSRLKMLAMRLKAFLLRIHHYIGPSRSNGPSFFF